METIFEIFFECIISLVTEGGMEVMSDPEHTCSWPRGIKIMMVVTTILFFLTVIGFLIVFGVIFVLEGKMIWGLILSVLGVFFLVLMLIRLRKVNNSLNASKG